MANGNLKDEATYYGDSEKYTGDSGSNTNMWVIEDVYDFVSVLNPADITDTNIYMRLAKDIDFNDHSTYKKGISSAIYSSNKFYLYGNKYKIRNIVAINATTGILKFQYIENVDFVNLVAIGCNVFPITMVNASECDFGVFVSSSLLAITATNIVDCTFNIKGKTKEINSLIKTSKNITFQSCHFNFDISGSFSSSRFIFHGYDEYTNISAYYTNCYFTGKVKNTGASLVGFSTNNSFTNCYFALEWTGGGLLKTTNVSTRSSLSVCFADKDLFTKNGSEWTTYAISGLSTLTTAQAQDADYLNSIGFAVVPIE